MRVVAVFVTYCPENDLFTKSLKSMVSQVDSVYVVDNSDRCIDFSTVAVHESVEIIRLGCNLGIAEAQNVGIRMAIDSNAGYIILSDQDTVFPDNYVSSMLPHLMNDPDAAAIAPSFDDQNKESTDGFIGVHPLFFKRIFPKNGLHEILQAIASGFIIKADVLKQVGLKNRDLFIDWVDLEWCWRARNAGYKILGNADVTIVHHLGDRSVNIGFRDVNTRSPVRHYYITRNAFYLALYCKVLDIPHRLVLFVKSFRYLIGYPLLAKPRLKNLRYVICGMVDGFRGRLGKIRL